MSRKESVIKWRKQESVFLWDVSRYGRDKLLLENMYMFLIKEHIFN